MVRAAEPSQFGAPNSMSKRGGCWSRALRGSVPWRMEYTWLDRNIPAAEKRVICATGGAFEPACSVERWRLLGPAAARRKMQGSRKKLHDRMAAPRKVPKRARKNVVQTRRRAASPVKQRRRSCHRRSFLRRGRELFWKTGSRRKANGDC